MAILFLACMLPFVQAMDFGQQQGLASSLEDDVLACPKKLHKLELEVIMLKRQLERMKYANSRRRGNTIITGPLGAINKEGAFELLCYEVISNALIRLMQMQRQNSCAMGLHSSSYSWPIQPRCHHTCQWVR
jgi:hypothetical protein